MFPSSSLLGYAPAASERRAHPRRSIDEDAELIIPDEYLTLPCRVTDISRHGARIICDVIPHAHARISLVMKDGGTFDGIAAWYENGQLGLRFLRAADQTAAITAIQ